MVGLGNPGARYRGTRHNIGFMVIDRLAAMTGVETVSDPELGGRAWTAETLFEEQRVVLAKPRTYMNRSGRAARALGERYGAGPDAFVVVHDDADLELGRIRVREDGGAGGHNGIRSLIDLWHVDEFDRVRLGVRGDRRGEMELADYVLAPFDESEHDVVERLVELGAEATRAVVADGAVRAMNDYNGRRVTRERPAADDETRTARPGGGAEEREGS